MVRPKECCNPLKKKGHNCVRHKLFLVTAKWNKKFEEYIDRYICQICRKDMYNDVKIASNVENEDPSTNSYQKEESELSIDLSDSEVDCYDDPNFESEGVEYSLNLEKVNHTLQDLGEPPIKKKLFSKLHDKNIKEIIADVIDVEGKKGNANVNGQKGEKKSDLAFVKNIKDALCKKNKIQDKIQVLTTIPDDWTIKKIRDTFSVSKGIASTAKKLKKKSGFASVPANKRGKRISDSTVEKVRNFYLSDFSSRLLPGIKDCKTVVKDGEKMKAQKRLVLFNLSDLHEQFTKEYPETPIGLSKFKDLRPRECILAGQSGTHNVCVCKMHQNVALKIYGIKRELKKRTIAFNESMGDFIKNSVCKLPTTNYFLHDCKKCPGAVTVMQKLEQILTINNVPEITFTQWIKTDRCDIVQITEKTEKFLEALGIDLSSVLKHDFLSKKQAAYFVETKSTVSDGEFVICLDFAENYTFEIQDAIQSHHWSNTQATLHPYVVYYRADGKDKHLNFVIISEKLNHDANSVHLFNTRLVQYLKKKFGSRSVNKFFYFSDGAGSQYKNKFNFLNLLYHKKDFGIEAEWNFFATSHGKGACDGIGGSVKRLAHKASMQRVTSDHIRNSQALFEWAKNAFKNIDFQFCSQVDHDTHEKKFRKRMSKAIAIKNTRQYHHYQPATQKQIQCKIFSTDVSSSRSTITH